LECQPGRRGYVTRFEVQKTFLAAYAPQDAGGEALRKYWIPADDLDNFNAAIVGEIVVTKTFEPERNGVEQP
jgi:hypothetical protein